jgi:hypothetical protein
MKNKCNCEICKHSPERVGYEKCIAFLESEKIKYKNKIKELESEGVKPKHNGNKKELELWCLKVDLDATEEYLFSIVK